MTMGKHECLVPSRLFCLLLSVCSLLECCSGLNPIEVHGYKFFDSSTGDEFVVKGIAYEPRPNTGSLNQNSVDYFTEEHRHIWERDIPILQSLGVNAIRLYAVDPTKNHDAFMCQANAAGIYVLVSLARDCPTCAVTRDQAPDCYPRALKHQGEAVINAFAKYDNVLGFSAGNEVNHFTPRGNPEWNGPCQRKFLRDMRRYIASCPNMRKVPIGVVSADSQRDEVVLYYNCESNVNDPYENAEWFGLNTYLSCNANATNFEDAGGFKALVDSFESYDYSIPVMLTEFGCLSETFPTTDGYEGQRTFQQAKWLLENPRMRDQFAGGFAFEYSIEMQNAIAESPYPFKKMGGQNYGIGFFSPENCDDTSIFCEYNPEPSFDNLKIAYEQAATSSSSRGLKLNNFTVAERRQGRTKCPSNFTALNAFKWKTDRMRDIRCPSKGPDSTFVCPANLSDLRVDMPTPMQSIWLTLLESILFLTVVTIIYCILMNQVDTMSDNVAKYLKDEPTWMTIAIPSVARVPGSDDSRSRYGSDGSGSDESAGLLSMKQWDYYHSASIDSDLSDKSVEKET